MPVRVAQFTVQLFPYIEASFTIVPFSHRAAILSKLYIATNPESYKLYNPFGFVTPLNHRTNLSNQIPFSVMRSCHDINVVVIVAQLAGVVPENINIGAVVSRRIVSVISAPILPNPSRRLI